MSDATSDLLAERGKTHGDFSDHAHFTQHLKLAMRINQDTQEEHEEWARLSLVQKEALEMIQLKIGRILAGNPNHKDHWDDIAGYARLVSERLP